MSHTIRGLIVGAFLGGASGLGICTCFLDQPILFPGDTIVAGALLCGYSGYRYGDEFFEWLDEHWHWWL